MKTVLLDKIGSVTLNCRLSREVRVSPDIPCVEGGVIAVRVLTSKSTYNQLELPSGRFSQIKPGDVIAGALGHRKALFGFSGPPSRPRSPRATRSTSSTSAACSASATASTSTSDSRSRARCSGQVLHFPVPRGARSASRRTSRIGAIAPRRQAGTSKASRSSPLVGSCMNAGKTAAACSLIQEFARRGLKVVAGKATGVSLRRDILAMEDAGARAPVDLHRSRRRDDDAGGGARRRAHAADASRPAEARTSSCSSSATACSGSTASTPSSTTRLLRATFAAVVLAANDPVAAWGGVRLLRERHGITTTVVTGPATDNDAGDRPDREAVRDVPRATRGSNPAGLADVVLAHVRPAPGVRARQETTDWLLTARRSGWPSSAAPATSPASCCGSSSQHPRFRSAGVVLDEPGAASRSPAAFPNLAGPAVDGLAFVPPGRRSTDFVRGEPIGLFFATPHGVTAALVDRVLSAAAREQAPRSASSTSRPTSGWRPADYERLYGQPHGAPARLAEFTCAIPEHSPGASPPATSRTRGASRRRVVVAAYPFFKLDLVDGPDSRVRVTGSSGSGPAPAANTHHPERSGNLYAYNDARAPARAGDAPPARGRARRRGAGRSSSCRTPGPFVRGIHATLFARPREAAQAGESSSMSVNAFYGDASFIRASTTPPKLTEVVGTNRAGSASRRAIARSS